MKNEDCLKSFGEHLRMLREKQNLSQQDLANNADVDKKTIQRIEQNLLNPSLDTLCSISIGLGISLSELLDFKYAVRKD
ncbi:MAG: helix-turn-helix transcriptional regulator [Chitinophagales bacterium]